MALLESSKKPDEGNPTVSSTSATKKVPLYDDVQPKELESMEESKVLAQKGSLDPTIGKYFDTVSLSLDKQVFGPREEPVVKKSQPTLDANRHVNFSDKRTSTPAAAKAVLEGPPKIV